MVNQLAAGGAYRDRLLAGAPMLLVGALAVGVALADVARDAMTGLVLLGIVENALPLVLSAGLLGSAVWLVGNWEGASVARVSQWSLAGLATQATVVGWVAGFQVLQGNLRPPYVAATGLMVGAGAGVLVGVYDVRRSRSRGRVREQRNQFLALFENSPDPIVSVDFVDGDPVVRDVNPAFERVFGYDAAAAVGDPLDAHIVPPDRRGDAAALNDRLADGQQVTREVRRETAGGLRTFELTAVPVEPGSLDVSAHLVYRDVTEREQRKQRLQVLYRVLRHDLRTELTVIRGHARALAEALSDPSLSEHTEPLLAAADDLLTLGERTRKIERLLADASDQHAVRPDSVARDVAETVADRNPEVSVETDIERPDPVTASGAVDDAVRVLVDRAADREAVDEVTVAVEPDSEEYVRLRVSFDAAALTPAERAVLDGEAEDSQLAHAEGLTVWLFYWAVTASGGRLEVPADEGAAASVAATLPVAG